MNPPAEPQEPSPTQHADQENRFPPEYPVHPVPLSLLRSQSLHSHSSSSQRERDLNIPNHIQTSIQGAVPFPASQLAPTSSASPARSRPPPNPVQQPPNQVHSVIPLKPTQSVSFVDLESQERSRRFTISAQPSAVNVTTQDTSQFGGAQHPVAPSVPASRKTSLTGRKNSSTNDVLSFMTTSNSAALANQLKQNQNQSTAHHGYISSSGSSRVNSPNSETSPHLPTTYSFEMSKKTGRKIHKSPSPPPFSPQVQPPSTTAPSVNPATLERSSSISGTNSNSAQPIKINLPPSSGSLSRRNSTKKSNKTIVASPVGPPVPFQQYLSKEDDGKFHILLGCTGSVATIKVPLIIDKLFQIFGKNKVSIQLVVTKSASHFLKGLKIHNDVKIWRDEDEWANYTDHSWNAVTTTTATTSNPLQSNGTTDSSANLSNLNPASNPQTPKKPKNPFDKMILHNELRRWADMMLVAPLSANTLAKISHGIADNLLTSIIRSWGPNITTSNQNVKKPILVAPAMNTFMYIHPITAKQIAVLSSPEYGFGIEVLKPVEKVLVCGDIGMGGMREWSDIVDIVRRRYVTLNAERIKRDEEEEEEEEGEDDDEDEDEDDDDEEEDDDDEDDEDDDEDEEENTKREHHVIHEEDEEHTGYGSTGDIEHITENANDDNDNDEMIFNITDQEGEVGVHIQKPHYSDDFEDDTASENEEAKSQRISIPREVKNIL